MNQSNRMVQGICSLVLLFCLIGSGLVATQVSAEAGRAQLTYTDNATEGDPPEVAAGIAMGAFRGLFVNYLWMRADRLKQEGKFHEAYELSAAITRLQPRFPRVWSFHAWNMAYNISVATSTREERWQWVKAGIELLRQEGIPKNPNDVQLHRELAWIFNHKVQGFMDDANRYYKKQLAREWHMLLGEPPRLQSGNEAATQQMVDWLEEVVSAPETLGGVIDRELADRNRDVIEENRLGIEDSLVNELATRIVDEAGLELNYDLLELYAVQQALDNSWFTQSAEEGGIPFAREGAERQLAQRGDSNSVFTELYRDEKYADTVGEDGEIVMPGAWSRLIPHVRKRVLVDEYNMSPTRMQRYTAKFGPLDWRHPSSHAVYWSHRGVELGLQRRGVRNFNTLNTDRITMHSLQELFRSGTVMYDPIRDTHLTMVSLHYIPSYAEIVLEVAARGGRSQDESRAFRTYIQGLQNFLKDAIRTTYRFGDIEQANYWFTELREFPGLNVNDPALFEDLGLDLATFVRKQLEEDDRFTIPHVAASEVEMALRGAFLNGLLNGDRQAFEGNIEYARQVHKRYFDLQDQVTLVDRDRNRMDEMHPDFAIAAGEVFLRILAYSDIEIFQSSLMYQRVPSSIQRVVYDALISVFAQQGVPPQLLAEMFPEPPGMEQYRAELNRKLRDQEEGRKAAMDRLEQQ
ncbi:MAG: hypothetical protein NXI14_12005 [bacterium]|nr:hypothetical protein [bacterium]